MRYRFAINSSIVEIEANSKVEAIKKIDNLMQYTTGSYGKLLSEGENNINDPFVNHPRCTYSVKVKVCYMSYVKPKLLVKGLDDLISTSKQTIEILGTVKVFPYLKVMPTLEDRNELQG
jgi:hypothetical protein